MDISFENIKDFAFPVENCISKWLFEDENGKFASLEHQDQIFPLKEEAANFIWNYQKATNIIVNEKYYKDISIFNSEFSDKKTIDKYLYNIGIPFKQEVFLIQQPHTVFILTWKMVIKYSHNLFFGHDQTVWEPTHNWQLDFHHDGKFTFGNNLIFNGQAEILRNREKFELALKQMEEREKRKNLDT